MRGHSALSERGSLDSEDGRGIMSNRSPHRQFISLGDLLPFG